MYAQNKCPFIQRIKIITIIKNRTTPTTSATAIGRSSRDFRPQYLRFILVSAMSLRNIEHGVTSYLRHAARQRRWSQSSFFAFLSKSNSTETQQITLFYNIVCIHNHNLNHSGNYHNQKKQLNTDFELLMIYTNCTRTVILSQVKLYQQL